MLKKKNVQSFQGSCIAHSLCLDVLGSVGIFPAVVSCQFLEVRRRKLLAFNPFLAKQQSIVSVFVVDMARTYIGNPWVSRMQYMLQLQSKSTLYTTEVSVQYLHWYVAAAPYVPPYEASSKAWNEMLKWMSKVLSKNLSKKCQGSSLCGSFHQANPLTTLSSWSLLRAKNRDRGCIPASQQRSDWRLGTKVFEAQLNKSVSALAD